METPEYLNSLVILNKSIENLKSALITTINIQVKELNCNPKTIIFNSKIQFKFQGVVEEEILGLFHDGNPYMKCGSDVINDVELDSLTATDLFRIFNIMLLKQYKLKNIK